MFFDKDFFLVFFILFVGVFIGLSLLVFFYSHSLNIARGDSMLPTYRDCTLLSVDDEYPVQNIVAGDVVVVDISSEGLDFNFFAHRVVSNNVSEMFFSTRGDNNELYSSESSIDGFFEYQKFAGLIDGFVELPEVICSER